MKTGAFVLGLFYLLASASTVAGESVGHQALASVVAVTAEVPPDARTARTLGPERAGSGVVIDSSGLILTIGYLILEAMHIRVMGPSGNTVSADFVAYDHPTGFGLIRARQPLGTRIIALGSARNLEPGEQVLIASRGTGGEAAQAVYVVSRREFTGGWEYLLDHAIFTSPPHPDFGGAALVDGMGRLVGIGSLQVLNAVPGRQLPGNMFVPIDLLKPILADLMLRGRSANLRPWLGARTEELAGRVFVSRVSKGGPAAQAGVEAGDLIVGVDGKPVHSLAEYYRTVWAFGAPGVIVPLNILKGVKVEEVRVVSGDRYDYLRLNPSY